MSANEVPKTTNEKILVVPTTKVWEIIPEHHGFLPGTLDGWDQLMSYAFFMDRPQAEEDPQHKQLIPYVLLGSAGKVFRYWRTKHAGESRLHHLYSLGVGGHIDESDINLFTQHRELLVEAAEREIREEVHFSGKLKIQYQGTLNDDGNAVGRVHLGLVFIADTGDQEPDTREAALGRGAWLPPQELNDGVEYETWSQILIDAGLPQKIAQGS